MHDRRFYCLICPSCFHQEIHVLISSAGFSLCPGSHGEWPCGGDSHEGPVAHGRREFQTERIVQIISSAATSRRKSVVWYFFWSRSELVTQQGMDQSPHHLFRGSVCRKLTGPLVRQRQVRERDHSDPDVVFVLVSAVTEKCAQSRVQSLGGHSKDGSCCLEIGVVGGVIEFTVVCAIGRFPHLWCWRHTSCRPLGTNSACSGLFPNGCNRPIVTGTLWWVSSRWLSCLSSPCCEQQ